MLPDRNVEALAKARLLSQDKEKEVFNALVSVITGEIQTLYDNIEGYVNSRYVDGATGELLDTLALIPYVIRPAFGALDIGGYFGYTDDSAALQYSVLNSAGTSLPITVSGGIWSEYAPARYAVDGGYFGFSDDVLALGWGGSGEYTSQIYIDEGGDYLTLQTGFRPATDDEFRRFIYAKTNANRSAVTTEDYIGIISLAAGEVPIYVVRKLKRLEVNVGNPDLTFLQKRAIQLATPSPAGVTIDFNSTFYPDNFFGFSDTPNAKGWDVGYWSDIWE
jgi:hypothetical protein